MAKETLVEIEFLGITKGDVRIETFSELGVPHGVGAVLSVPPHRAEKLIKTYPDGFRYTDGSSDVASSGAEGSGSNDESDSESEDSDSESDDDEPVKPKKPLRRKAKKPRKNKVMRGRKNKSL